MSYHRQFSLTHLGSVMQCLSKVRIGLVVDCRRENWYYRKCDWKRARSLVRILFLGAVYEHEKIFQAPVNFEINYVYTFGISESV